MEKRTRGVEKVELRKTPGQIEKERSESKFDQTAKMNTFSP